MQQLQTGRVRSGFSQAGRFPVGLAGVGAVFNWRGLSKRRSAKNEAIIAILLITTASVKLSMVQVVL
jgi:hypothetical protein